jgi:hypothetical protein
MLDAIIVFGGVGIVPGKGGGTGNVADLGYFGISSGLIFSEIVGRFKSAPI